MSDLALTDDLFFTRGGLDRVRAEALVADALHGAEDGELFLEYCQSEAISLDDGRIRSTSFDTTSGFGLRAVIGDVFAYAHAAGLEEAALRRAAATVRAVHAGQGGVTPMTGGPLGERQALYPAANPLGDPSFATKVALLQEIDAWLRARSPLVTQVQASLAGEWQAVQILRGDGHWAADVRPLVRLGISVVVTRNGRRESGSAGMGGRGPFTAWTEPACWQACAEDALRQALVNLDAVPAPAGEMTVVLGPGWPGILLHEAIGHGLEGDFNRKGSSAFSGLMGQRVAAPGVTVVDDGALPGRRGSVAIDDEGTPGGRTVLIEDGILTGYMQDRMNARLMRQQPTGNGRRQSYAHAPMPRMTNTFMLAGDRDPEEILASVDNGLYAATFGGGQVDIVSGKFVFSCTEAWKIEKGRKTVPVKGATLIGNGPDALTRVSMIGKDAALDPGIGTCGNNGQGVPVGVGQPTLRLDGLTVGGTEA